LLSSDYTVGGSYQVAQIESNMNQPTISQIVTSIKRGRALDNAGRIVAIDGPAGAGKTTLANRLKENIKEARVEIVHMDDLYDGWQSALTPALGKVLDINICSPVSQGKPFKYRKYDWLESKFGPLLEFSFPDILILEGVGAGQKTIRKFLDELIWIEISAQVGLQRVLQRDGAYLEKEMEIWQMRENFHFAADNTRDCATIRIDGANFI